MLSSTARYLSDVLVSKVKETANTSMSVLNFCLKNKKFSMMFITCNVILPLVDAELKKLVVNVECGSFQVHRTENTDSNFASYDQFAQVCFAAFINIPHILLCKLPVTPAHQPGQVQLTMFDTPAGTEMCSNYYRLRDNIASITSIRPNV